MTKAQIHSNFHILLLEPASRNTPVLTESNIEENKEYGVEKILDSRRANRKNYYLVKWLEYRREKNSWEPTENFSPEVAQKIEEY